jgi:3-oxosteroid 1-dehydrogenase
VPRLRGFDVATHTLVNCPCNLVFDSQFAARYAFAGCPPGQPIPDWVARGETLSALAERRRVDPQGLDATAATFNAGAREGVDPLFGRGQSSWARHSTGDASSKANPNLGPVEEPPFYGVELVVSATGSGGLNAVAAGASAQFADPEASVPDWRRGGVS